MKSALAVAMGLAAIMGLYVLADTCSGSKTCSDGEIITCSVTVPVGGRCEIDQLDIGLHCIAYDANSNMVDRDTPLCWPGGGGASTGNPATTACSGVSGAWWVGCNPFQAL